MTDEPFAYLTPRQFRQALKDHLTAVARREGRHRLAELQRQFAYDRALARLFTSADPPWVLKGGGALLARLPEARHSRDLDMFFDAAVTADDAVVALRQSLDTDLGDHFLFEVNRAEPLQDEVKGSRVHVAARLGATLFAAFHIDVVVSSVMTGDPDIVPPLVEVNFPGLVRPSYRAFPLADHLADKLFGVCTPHRRHDQVVASSRVKDLVDIAIVASTRPVAADRLTTAVVAGGVWRNLSLPAQFVVPDGWARRYPKVAADAVGPVPTFAEAVDLGSRLFDPILARVARGGWDPTSRSWLQT